jgi:hypothetical protein
VGAAVLIAMAEEVLEASAAVVPEEEAPISRQSAVES